jgi:antitoxin (DNA-binding transcriptional repressor) of toxin-antitoxin stability system
MLQCDIEELEVDFSAIIAKVEAGAIMTVYKNDQPIIEITPVQQQETFAKRPVGLARKRYPDWKIGEDFFDPLPDDILAYFTGERD